MISRLLTLPDDESFFLFGPRGVGKTTLLRHLPWFSDALYLNLLKPDEEMRLARQPGDLEGIVRALPAGKRHIIIDEVQKVPRLLDVVHDLIETTDKKFILTGSSARKLKHGGANLLAGRAFVYNLSPFTYFELRSPVALRDCLHFGLLPKIFEYNSTEKKVRYLEAYTQTYLKEEIWAERFIRELAPFRRFLEVAAQANGKIVNFSNIARDVGASDNTIQKYFSILEDTLLGFFLEPFHHSFRKRLAKTPKFYFFDTGVVRALSGLLNVPLVESTSHFGDVFEHFVILQAIEMANVFHRDYRFSFLKTKDDAEIDLVVERPGKALLLIEIKSTDHVREEHLKTLKLMASDIGDCEAICLSREPRPRECERVVVLPWMDGIQRYFGS